MYAVELEDIWKTFPSGTQANRGITLRVQAGEVHGLLGENGAGKTTLMNILYGLLSKDRGRVVIKGEEVELQSPQDAIVRGVGMVHQHFRLIPSLTVTENVVLGLEPVRDVLRRAGRKSPGPVASLMPLDLTAAARRIREIAVENGLAVDPDARVADISVGMQQRVEIMKALYRQADILILDEPTSVLTPQEVDELFVTLEHFREQGRTIILITHKLREPMALCDRISVLRDGELVGTVDREETSPEELARMMVGRTVSFKVQKAPARPGDVALVVEDLHVQDNRGVEAVRGASISVRRGEVVGIAGVEGNGQTELVEAVAGLRRVESGRILVDGVDVTDWSARDIREAGVCHIPEDRQRRGLVLGFSVMENLILGSEYRAPFATGPGHAFLDLSAIHDFAVTLVQDYDIRAGSVRDAAATLSGGNQQKVVVARELAGRPRVVLAAQPTRGLDVGATEYIHRVLVDMRDSGAAVLLVSAELDEIMNLSDRIAVMFDGRIVALRDPEETSAEELGLLMAGHSVQEVST